MLNADGYVEVYADKGVRIQMAHRLTVHSDNQVEAEKYMEKNLPFGWGDLLEPSNMAGTDTCRTITPSQEKDRLDRMQILQMMSEARWLADQEIEERLVRGIKDNLGDAESVEAAECTFLTMETMIANGELSQESVKKISMFWAGRKKVILEQQRKRNGLLDNGSSS